MLYRYNGTYCAHLLLSPSLMRTAETASARESGLVVGFGSEVLADPRAAAELKKLALQFGQELRIAIDGSGRA